MPEVRTQLINIDMKHLGNLITPVEGGELLAQFPLTDGRHADLESLRQLRLSHARIRPSLPDRVPDLIPDRTLMRFPQRP
ncbi:hypothetical protein AA0312_2038 [Acetobacter tropicalis NRIC 0312]|nr:hypothetical protein ATR1_003d0018 [Acetobacter tropicalis]GBR70823.1 hypothetical protein AA0312_2038 [Acetobacter tropicalis NRIC 0312]